MVGERDQGRAVGDDDDGAVAGELEQGVGDDVLGERVEVGGRLVEEDPGPVAEHDPSQGEASTLPGREGRAVLAQGRVEPVGKLADALLEGDPAQHRPDRVVGGVRGAESHVVGDAAGNEERALRQQCHLGAPRGTADGDTVDEEPAACRGCAARRARRAGSTCRRRRGR